MLGKEIYILVDSLLWPRVILWARKKAEICEGFSACDDFVKSC